LYFYKLKRVDQSKSQCSASLGFNDHAPCFSMIYNVVHVCLQVPRQ